MTRTVIDLGGRGWQVRGYLGEEWRWLDLAAAPRTDRPEWLAATVPGAVVADLHAAGEVPDPYLDCNSLAVEWVADRAWVYRRVFDRTLGSHERAFLRLEGLETPAHIYLDGALAGEHDSPSLPAVFEITDRLRRTSDGATAGRHVLAVVLDPSPHEQPQMGRTSLVRRHRGRMREGWDFCPRFPEAGISGPVALETTGPIRIASFSVMPHLDGGLRHATVDFEATLNAGCGDGDDVELEWAIEGADGQMSRSSEHPRPAGLSTVRHSFVLEEPKLWWPNGLGTRPLYRASVAVRRLGAPELSDDRSLEFGLRRIELVRNVGASEDALGYTLRVNGRRVYLRGWNWVPDDVMPGVDRPGRLERLLRLAKASNANLLRVWGGGRIETDRFYHLCDRLGLLVWQEFLLSSAGQDNEPSVDPAYLAHVAAEAEPIVRSRRHHPSLAVWCGGNELSRGSERRPLNESTSPVILALGDVVRRHDPERAWLPTSPSGPVFMRDASDAHPDELHDVHGPWQHRGLGRQERSVARPAPLLHSEFGAPSLADSRSIEATFSAAGRGEPIRASAVWRHRGSWWICDDLVRDTFHGAAENPADSLEGLEWASQYLQAQALRGWIEANRRAWPHNSGSIPWQFDEPYPSGYGTCSVDWFGRPKASYWAVRRAYAPVLVSARFDREAWGSVDAFEADLWLTADEPQQVDGTLEATVFDERGCAVAGIRQPIRYLLDRSAVVGRIAAPLADVPGPGAFVLDLALQSAGCSVATNRYLFSAEHTLAPLADACAAAALDARVVPLPERPGSFAVSVLNRGTRLAPLVRLDRALARLGQDAIDPADLADDCFALLSGEHRLVRIRPADGAPARAAGPGASDRPAGRAASPSATSR